MNHWLQIISPELREGISPKGAKQVRRQDLTPMQALLNSREPEKKPAANLINDPLRGIPFRGEYGYRRVLNEMQWRARYRGIAWQYFHQAYLRRNPFVVTWMEGEK